MGAVRTSHHDHAHLSLPCVHPNFYRGEHRFINRRRSEGMFQEFSRASLDCLRSVASPSRSSRGVLIAYPEERQ